MKCFNHEDREAVATCQHCGKALCKACASKYTPCLCDECFAALQQEAHAERVAAAEGQRQSGRERLSFSSGDLSLNCVLGAILTILAAVANADNEYYSLLELAPLAPLFFCFPAGWRLVSRWVRAGEEQMGVVHTYDESVGSLIGGLLFKLAASWFLGIPAFLFQVYKVLRARKEVKTAEAELMRVKQ